MKSWVRSATQQVRAPNFGLPALNYHVDLAKLSPQLQAKFIQLDCDEESEVFLQSCTDVSIFSSFAFQFLRLFYSVTDANGMLGRGQMFVFSEQQISKLIGSYVGGVLLDIGAGDGNVTQKYSSLVDHIETTEVSGPMVQSLNNLGLNCTHTTEITSEHFGDRKFKIISLLNVLDRADKPITLMNQIKQFLDPDQGILVIAVVLPFSSFVEDGNSQRSPIEELPMQGGLCGNGNSFEEAVEVIVNNVFDPAGFEVQSFSRVPYLCQGDLRSPYYVLDDALFVLKLK